MASPPKKIGSIYSPTWNFDRLQNETTPAIILRNTDEMMVPANDPPAEEAPSTTVPSQLQIALSAQTLNRNNPEAHFHTTFTPNPFHTAMCDSCNQKNSGHKLLQRCNTCNRQWCERCIRVNDGNHPTNHDHYDWKPRPGLQPSGRIRASENRGSTKKDKSITKTTKAITTAATRVANAAALRNNKSTLERSQFPEEEDDDYEDNRTPYDGSKTDDDPMDEEYVRKIFDRPYPSAPGSMYGHREYHSAEYGYPSPMYMAPVAPMVPSMGYGIPRQRTYSFHHYNPPPVSMCFYPQPYHPTPYLPPMGTYPPQYHPAPSPSMGPHIPPYQPARSPLSTVPILHPSHRAPSSLSMVPIPPPSHRAPSPIASLQSKVAAFRYATQMTWEKNTTLRELRARGKEDVALETFQTTIKLKGMERGISEEDVANVFQRVTGGEMSSG